MMAAQSGGRGVAALIFCGAVTNACGSSGGGTAASGGRDNAAMGGTTSTSGGAPSTGGGTSTLGGRVSAGGRSDGTGGELLTGGAASGGKSGGIGAGGAIESANGGAGGSAGDGGEESGGASGDGGLVTQGSASEDAACDQKLHGDWALHPPAVGFGSASSAQSYDQVIGALMANYGVPGGAVSVTYEGRLVLARAWGLSDKAGFQPAYPANLFRVASLSKQLTAIAVLKLVEAGTLGLDTSAFSYLPAALPLPGKTKNPALASVTVRHLLNHSGGWNRDSEAVGDPMFASKTIATALGEAGPASADDTIRYMMDKPLTYTPGSTYCYSNLGYAILGSIIEAVTHGDYESFVRANVLAPAGATDMRIGGDFLADAAEDEVTYYDYPNAPLAASIFPQVTNSVPWPYGGFSMQAMKAHGGWIASPVDFLRVARGVDTYVPPHPLISATNLSAMLQNPNLPSCNSDGTTTPASTGYWYGFGYQVNQYGNYWHTGSLPGTATEDVIAQNKYNFAAFFNTRPSDANGFASELDRDLWTAFDGVSAFSTQDYFDQYPSYSEWLGAPAFSSRARMASEAHQYASRVEGRVHGDEVQFRATFAPLHAGVVTRTSSGLDCTAYVAATKENASRGLALASLQTFVDPDGITRYQATWAAE